MFKDNFVRGFHTILPKSALTCMAGCLGNVSSPFIKNFLIQQFIRTYEVNMAEACEPEAKGYTCFNDFFIRHLKAECRPLAKADIIMPVDGYVSEIGHIKEGLLLQAKGRYYTTTSLLACNESLSRHFNNGLFATFYLSPKDYHRVHMPVTGRLMQMIHIPGKLFSVQPATTRSIPMLFARNERLVVCFETTVGLMAMVLVGATIVGKIGTSWLGDLRRTKQIKQLPCDTSLTLKQGEEMGYFKLGSTVVLLFADRNRVSWINDIKPQAQIRFGQALGTRFKSSST